VTCTIDQLRELGLSLIDVNDIHITRLDQTVIAVKRMLLLKDIYREPAVMYWSGREVAHHCSKQNRACPRRLGIAVTVPREARVW
jgi:hypothetical protein